MPLLAWERLKELEGIGMGRRGLKISSALCTQGMPEYIGSGGLGKELRKILRQEKVNKMVLHL